MSEVVVGLFVSSGRIGGFVKDFVWANRTPYFLVDMIGRKEGVSAKAA